MMRFIVTVSPIYPVFNLKVNRMPDLAVLAVFIPTFFFVSITPGMCMTLAMTLGMSIGVRRTMWMMIGELIGVAIVAIAAVFGVAGIMLNYPDVFEVLKWIGGGYLAYIGVNTVSYTHLTLPTTPYV